MELRVLIQLWENGQTNSQQEEELREYFRDSENLESELLPYSVIFKAFSSIREESSARSLDLESEAKSFRIFRQRTYVWALSACCALALIIGGLYFTKEPYCYVNGKAVRSMRKAIAATESLQNINQIDESLMGFKILDFQ